jgi:hypothetical protein
MPYRTMITLKPTIRTLCSGGFFPSEINALIIQLLWYTDRAALSETCTLLRYANPPIGVRWCTIIRTIRCRCIKTVHEHNDIAPTIHGTQPMPVIVGVGAECPLLRTLGGQLGEAGVRIAYACCIGDVTIMECLTNTNNNVYAVCKQWKAPRFIARWPVEWRIDSIYPSGDVHIMDETQGLRRVIILCDAT